MHTFYEMKFQLKYSNMYVNELLSRSFIIDKLKNKGMYKILDIKKRAHVHILLSLYYKMKLSVSLALTASILLCSGSSSNFAHAMKNSEHLLYPIDASIPSPPSVFPIIEHPFPPVYADPNFKTVVPTSSWISNLFYPSVNNLAPTTPDPYILRLLDDFGGNPGLSISQPHDKVYIYIYI